MQEDQNKKKKWINKEKNKNKEEKLAENRKNKIKKLNDYDNDYLGMIDEI